MSAITAEMFPGRFRLRSKARAIEVLAGDFEALRAHVERALGDREPDPFWQQDGQVTRGTRVILTIEHLGRASIEPTS